ncbi:Late expression factor 6 [Perigonia lusca single nucleopolyhedrovirus]|uniref:Late expression factor 6 n=1 Tax=Perigonia lusca single nucleopolyhedrovirus TaxID=1675865 RepID=A0A0M3WPA2_9ABAC|nr:Late expression factor 6 [Perigonia lusca single nucleopolyhedrovirus]AKN80628.1 Late expression factor 6 [Perigonia lusca single nucleopolyhedrovirus]
MNAAKRKFKSSNHHHYCTTFEINGATVEKKFAREFIDYICGGDIAHDIVWDQCTRKRLIVMGQYAAKRLLHANSRYYWPDGRVFKCKIIKDDIDDVNDDINGNKRRGWTEKRPYLKCRHRIDYYRRQRSSSPSSSTEQFSSRRQDRPRRNSYHKHHETKIDKKAADFNTVVDIHCSGKKINESPFQCRNVSPAPPASMSDWYNADNYVDIDLNGYDDNSLYNISSSPAVAVSPATQAQSSFKTSDAPTYNIDTIIM